MRVRLLLAALLLMPLVAVPAGAASGTRQPYLVVLPDGMGIADGRAAVASAGGRVVEAIPEVGLLSVTADATLPYRLRGADVVRADALRPVATLPDETPSAAAGRGGASEPLSAQQWGNQVVGATEDGSYRIELGDRRVAVGVLDSGIDAGHPDLSSIVDRARSRTFARHMPDIDGPCPTPDCVSPPEEDPLGHGTHTAGVIAAARNGLGTAGVAPGVRLVSLRVAQDSGYVFPLPVVRALVYSGYAGLNVVNMAFTLDPWLFHCAAHPDDTAEEQAEQRVMMTVIRRAVAFARSRGVLSVASLGDQGADLGKPFLDDQSPTYPAGAVTPRQVDGACQVLPAETDGVLGVTRLGRDGGLGQASNFGLGAADIAAPGGPGATVTDRILAPYPERAAIAQGMVGPDGAPVHPSLVRDCRDGVCGYYRYANLASSFVSGVAALVVSRYGRPGRDGMTLDPATTERILLRTARPVPCPDNTPACEGRPGANGFYGAGVVDAVAALGGRR